MSNYEITPNTISHRGRTLYQIKEKSSGKLGGYIESNKNLAQVGKCFIEAGSKVYGNALIKGDVIVRNSEISSGQSKTAVIKGNGLVENCDIHGSMHIEFVGKILNTKLKGHLKVTINPMQVKPLEIEDSEIESSTRNIIIEGGPTIRGSRITGFSSIKDVAFIKDCTLMDCFVNGCSSLTNIFGSNSRFTDNVVVWAEDESKIVNTKVKDFSRVFGIFKIQDCLLMDYATIHGGPKPLYLKNGVKVSKNGVISAYGRIESDVIVTDNAVVLGEVEIQNKIRICKSGLCLNSSFRDEITLKKSSLIESRSLRGKMSI